MVSLFKILWIIDALMALVVVYFFFIGIGDNTVSAFNIVLWLIILGVLAAIIFGSIWLKSHNHPGIAIATLLLLAIPALCYLIFILLMIFGNAKWN